MNLLRQELAGTCIYLDALQKTTSQVEPNQNGSHDEDDDAKVKTDAEEKLVSFCGQVLKEASDFQSSIGETTNMEIHQVLGLRSPVIVTVSSFSPYLRRSSYFIQFEGYFRHLINCQILS